MSDDKNDLTHSEFPPAAEAVAQTPKLERVVDKAPEEAMTRDEGAQGLRDSQLLA